MRDSVKFTSFIISLIIFGFIFIGCSDGGGGAPSLPPSPPITQPTTVNFESINADGSTTQTTTQLTLSFSQEVYGLTEDDITLSGISGIQKGTLSGSGSSYTLPISGFTSGGTLTVSVAKTGYSISNSSRTVTIYYYVAPTVGFEILLDAMSEWELVDQNVYVTANTNRIFTVNGTYSTYRWYLDGALVSSSSSYTFNKPVSVYQLSVIVTKSNGDSRSARCWINVGTTVTYTVTYNLNGGTGTTPTAQTVNAGNSITLASSTGFSRSGYTFGGWNTNTSGSGTNYNASSSFTPANNITLYAKWTSNTSTYPITSTITVGGSMYTGTLGAGQTHYIRVSLTAGSTYRIRWNDSDNTTGYTDIKVGLINESNSTTVQAIVDNSSTNNFTYTVPSGASGNYLIAVQGYNTSNSGTYAVGCAFN